MSCNHFHPRKRRSFFITLRKFHTKSVIYSNTIGSRYHTQILSGICGVFANCPGNLGSIPGRVIPKTQKMVLDASLLNTQHYKVRIKGEVEQSREKSSALYFTLV